MADDWVTLPGGDVTDWRTLPSHPDPRPKKKGLLEGIKDKFLTPTVPFSPAMHKAMEEFNKEHPILSVPGQKLAGATEFGTSPAGIGLMLSGGAEGLGSGGAALLNRVVGGSMGVQGADEIHHAFKDPNLTTSERIGKGLSGAIDFGLGAHGATRALPTRGVTTPNLEHLEWLDQKELGPASVGRALPEPQRQLPRFTDTHPEPPPPPAPDAPESWGPGLAVEGGHYNPFPQISQNDMTNMTLDAIQKVQSERGIGQSAFSPHPDIDSLLSEAKNVTPSPVEELRAQNTGLSRIAPDRGVEVPAWQPDEPYTGNPYASIRVGAPTGPEAEELNYLADIKRPLTPEEQNRFRELQSKLFPNVKGDPFPSEPAPNPFSDEFPSLLPTQGQFGQTETRFAPGEARGQIAQLGPVRDEYQKFANENNTTMQGIPPERGVPVVHNPQYGGFQHHRRGNETWITSPMFPDQPIGPFSSDIVAGDWVQEVQETPTFRSRLDPGAPDYMPPSNRPDRALERLLQGVPEYQGLPEDAFYSPEEATEKWRDALALLDETPMRASIEEPPAPPSNVVPFEPKVAPPPERPLTPGMEMDLGPLGEDYPPTGDIQGIRQQQVLGQPKPFDIYKDAIGEADPTIDQPIPLPQGQMELPWSRGQGPLPTDTSVRPEDRFIAPPSGPAEPQQMSLEDQITDAEIKAYLEGEDATPPEMIDLSQYGPKGLDVTDPIKSKMDQVLYSGQNKDWINANLNGVLGANTQQLGAGEQFLKDSQEVANRRNNDTTLLGKFVGDALDITNMPPEAIESFKNEISQLPDAESLDIIHDKIIEHLNVTDATGNKARETTLSELLRATWARMRELGSTPKILPDEPPPSTTPPVKEGRREFFGEKPPKFSSNDTSKKVYDPSKLKHQTAQNWGQYVKYLDERNAPDFKYREIMSTGAKANLKRGETWRDKVIKGIEYFESTVKKEDRELAGGEGPKTTSNDESKAPPFGKPGSQERWDYIAWEAGQNVRKFEAKLAKLKASGKSESQINWSSEWQNDTRTHSFKEAEREIEYLKDREEKAINYAKEQRGQVGGESPKDTANSEKINKELDKVWESLGGKPRQMELRESRGENEPKSEEPFKLTSPPKWTPEKISGEQGELKFPDPNQGKLKLRDVTGIRRADLDKILEGLKDHQEMKYLGRNYARTTLAKLENGKPGLEVIDGAPGSQVVKAYQLTFRDSTGKPIGYASISGINPEPPGVMSLAIDENSGLGQKNALLAIGKKLIELKAVIPTGSYSGYTKNLLESLSQFLDDEEPTEADTAGREERRKERLDKIREEKARRKRADEAQERARQRQREEDARSPY
jgi:hypothetical protein